MLSMRASLLWMSWAKPPTIISRMGVKSAPARTVMSLRGPGSSTPRIVSMSRLIEMRA
jgi:hypothetical protein